jgi:hypothetical protein
MKKQWSGVGERLEAVNAAISGNKCVLARPPKTCFNGERESVMYIGRRRSISTTVYAAVFPPRRHRPKITWPIDLLPAHLHPLPVTFAGILGSSELTCACTRIYIFVKISNLDVIEWPPSTPFSPFVLIPERHNAS